MGWWYQNKPPGMTVRQFIEKEYPSLEILDFAMVNFREVYMACRSPKSNEHDRVFAAVFLIQFCPKSFHNFGYKSMDETVGPYQHNCPEHILKLLSPIEPTCEGDEWALAWRRQCWERIEKMNARPSIRKGTIIAFDRDPLSKPLRYLRIYRHSGIHAQVPDSAAGRIRRACI